MKRPLAGVLVGFTAGILLGRFLPPPPLLLWELVLAVAPLAWWRTRWQTGWLWLLLLLAGWANVVSHTAALAPDDLRLLLGNAPAAVTVRGVINEPPRVKLIERSGKLEPHTLTLLAVSALNRGTRWESARGLVMGSTPGTLDARFFPGQSVEVTGALDPPAPPLAEGLFDDRDYLRNRGVYYQLRTSATNDWQPAPDARTGPPLTQRFLNWSKRTLALGLPAVDEPLRLLWAMALGWRTAFTGDVGDPFLRAGTMHLFAIDGLRIALVSGMLITLLRLARLSRAGCGLVCLPALWFYTAATGWEPSAIRATVMMTVIIFGWALQRPTNLLNSLAAAALIILAWDPQELYAAGFQLSFLVVLVIGLLLPPLNEWINRWCQCNPLVPLAMVPRWQRGSVALLRTLLRFLALSLAAWIGSIPLSAKYFNLFSPVSPLANVVAVPLGTGALTGILGSLACGAWCPGAAVLFNHSAWFFMVALMRVSEFASNLPAAYYYVTAPSWPAIALYYALLVAGLTGHLNVPKAKFALAVTITGLIAAVAICLWTWQPARREVRLTVLPLNGSPVVYVAGGGAPNRWMLNCGDESGVQNTLIPFLHAQGVNRVPQLILTTDELDDGGGAAKLDAELGVNQLFTSDSSARSAPLRARLARFDQPPGRRQTLRLNDTAGVWTVLHPGPAPTFPRAEDNALVLRGQFHHSRVLFLADLGRNGQSALLARTNDLRADIVIAGLPARDEPLSDALLQAVGPQIVVIVDAEYPVSRRAGPVLKSRLERYNIPIIYTQTAGAVTIREHPAGWEITTMDGRHWESAHPAN